MSPSPPSPLLRMMETLLRRLMMKLSSCSCLHLLFLFVVITSIGTCKESTVAAAMVTAYMPTTTAVLHTTPTATGQPQPQQYQHNAIAKSQIGAAPYEYRSVNVTTMLPSVDGNLTNIGSVNKTSTLVPHPPPTMSKFTTTKLYNKGLPKKRRTDDQLSSIRMDSDETTLPWRCPNITGSRSLECRCDLPHTLRCNGDLHGLTLLAERLRASPYAISLLDCSLRNVTFLSDARIFEDISLHGLVISSGEIKRVHKSAFLGIKGKLQALGLPGNALLAVPWSSISTLADLERLDLSNNKIKAVGTTDFAGLSNLMYLELSNNQISSISQRAFANLRKLEVIKLGGNRLGDYPSSLKSLTQCFNLRQLDLAANNLAGPLMANTLPSLRNLETLNLNRNLIKSVQNKALQNFSQMISLSLRHNQIDVLQDHAFFGLGRLESLDLSYNGIVAISSASLQHLTRLTTLDLTHNFLRALTADLIAPLPSLRELRLAGNDISIVAKNALDGARELKSLSIQENPLSCDCGIRSFAEWLQVAKIQAKDLISPTCVTPPRLEGAPLIQVPLESLSCDLENVEKDNASILEQLEAISKQNHSSHINNLSEEIVLHELHYSSDYGLILTWILNLSRNDYMCDAIFVYREENINEILIDNSPIHCESKIINGQNTVSVIVPDSSSLDIGESYRFCLVMVQEQNPKADLNVGCSNITKLLLSAPGVVTEVRQQLKHRPPYYVEQQTQFIDNNHAELTEEYSNAIGGRKFLQPQQQSHLHHASATTTNYEFLDSLSKSFLPGLGLGILVTSVLVLIWAATRIRHSAFIGNDAIGSGTGCGGGGGSGVNGGINSVYTNSSSDSSINNNNNSTSRPSTPTATTCYTASEHIARLTDAENGARYLKLQATTSL